MKEQENQAEASDGEEPSIEEPREMTDAELEGDEDSLDGTHDPSSEDANALPDWALHCMPPDLVVPPERRMAVMRFKPAWTDMPSKGERSVVVWGLTIAEERLAIKASRGDGSSVTDELAKRMVRAIDGKVVGWGTTGTQETSRLWRELGVKCVDMIRRHYVIEHSLKAEQKLDFLANCYVARTNVAG